MSQLTINGNDLLRIDGIPVAKVVQREDGLYLQFKDQDRMRSSCRGSAFVEIKLADFSEHVLKVFVGSEVAHVPEVSN